MEAAVAQLIKTVIIKAGNSPAACAAIAQHCPAAGTVQLLCSPALPQAGSPSSQMVLPAGLASAPNGPDCPWQQCWEGTLSRAFAHQVFMHRLLCAGPCAAHSLPRELAPTQLRPQPPHPLSSSPHPSLLLDHSLPGLPGFPLSALQPPPTLLVPPARKQASPALTAWTEPSP